MSYIERIKEKIASYKDFPATYSFTVNHSMVQVRQISGRAKTDCEGDPLRGLVEDNLKDYTDSTEMLVKVDSDRTFNDILRTVSAQLMILSQKLSLAKKPRATKMFKELYPRINNMTYGTDDKIRELAIGVYLYYMTNEITVRANPWCGHGKNVFALLTKISKM